MSRHRADDDAVSIVSPRRGTIPGDSDLDVLVVVLTAIDELPADDETTLLYVGLSRARVHLIVIATDETMSRLRLSGGERAEAKGAFE